MPRKPLALTQGSYQARSLVAEAQRCINLYPEKNPEGSSFPYSFYPCPGLRTISSPPVAGYGRGLYYSSSGQLFACVGNIIYLINFLGNNTVSWTNLSPQFSPDTTIASGGPGMVSMTDNTVNLVIVDGTTTGYQGTLGDSPPLIFPIADPTCIGGDFVIYIDGFLGFNQINSRNWYTSLDNTLTFDPTFIAAKGGYNDKLIALRAVHREAWLIGRETTEIWYDAGNQGGMAFSPIPGTFIQHGTCAPYSVASHDLAIFWLSQDQNGNAEVMMGENYQAMKVSTPAIEWEISQYTQISDAVGMTYLQNGHIFYILSFPSADVTWVYDKSQQLWHQRAWTDQDGILHRIRPSCMASVNGRIYALDWENGNLYLVDETLFTDTDTFVYYTIAGPPSPPTIQKPIPIQSFMNSAESNISEWSTGMDESNNLIFTTGPADSQEYQTSYNFTTGRINSYANINSLLGTYFQFQYAPVLDPSGNLWGFNDTPNVLNEKTITQLIPGSTWTLGLTWGNAGDTPPTGVPNPSSLVWAELDNANYLIGGGFISGDVWVVRTDGGGDLGFWGHDYHTPGATNSVCPGPSNGSSFTAYWTSQPFSIFGSGHTLGQTIIDGSAASYNPADWPTPNPGISSSIIASYLPIQFDPHWTSITLFSGPAYDQTDGNVIIQVSGSGGGNGNYIVKLSTVNGDILWSVPVANGNGFHQQGNTKSVIGAGYYMYFASGGVFSSGTLYIIKTSDGSFTSNALFAGNNGVTSLGPSISNDLLGCLVGNAGWNATGSFLSYLNSTPSSGASAAAIYFVTPSTPNSGKVTNFAPNPMSFIRSFPHIVIGGQRLLLNAFFAKVSGGGSSAKINALQPPNNDPQIYLRYSTNGGRSFGQKIPITLGSTGEFDTQPTWRNLGIALGRDVVFELSWSGPACKALFGAWLDFTPLDT